MQPILETSNLYEQSTEKAGHVILKWSGKLENRNNYFSIYATHTTYLHHILKDLEPVAINEIDIFPGILTLDKRQTTLGGQVRWWEPQVEICHFPRLNPWVW